MALLKPRYPRVNWEDAQARGLVGAWPVSEGGGAALNDRSGYRNTGTFSTAPLWVPGQFGSALSFDGTTQRIDAGNTTSLQVSTSNVGVSFWVKDPAPFDASNAVYVAGKYDGGGVGWYVAFFITGASDNNVYWRPGDAAFPNGIASGVNLDDAKWHHIAISQSGTVATLFADGVLRGTFTSCYQNTSTVNSMLIGGIPGQFLTGKLDEVRLYNRPLQPLEVKQIYADPFAIYRQRPRSRVAPFVAASDTLMAQACL